MSARIEALEAEKFPSPCGEEVMKDKEFNDVIEFVVTFPSPCGEEVMKDSY